MGPWLGVLNAYATVILHIFNSLQNHALNNLLMSSSFLCMSLTHNIMHIGSCVDSYI